MQSKCKIPPASAGIDVQTKFVVERIKDVRSSAFYDMDMSVRRGVYDFLYEFSEEIHIPDDLIRRLEPLLPHIDVISIEKGGKKIDTHIYRSNQLRYKQPWNITLDTWRASIGFKTDTEEGAIGMAKFLFDIPKTLEREVKNLVAFFGLPRAEQKKWMDFRQVFGSVEKFKITPEIQKLIDEV